MKPLKLTMTAFGPYKHSEIIDFTKLEQNNLFVISGNTGAGKTTIFDGICFALFGSASGTDREDNRMLRSDFADDHTHTAVELEFEIHGRKFRILRQLGHVKKGNKSKTGDKFEFFEQVDGKEIPCVDRQMVSEIDKKVESLIGLTQDQFKQIVMLPQGEFRKLLTSKTENKEAILRRLFKTEDYKMINELLRNKKNTVEQEYEQVRQMRDNYIEHIRQSLPQRDESVLFELLSMEHYNTSQIVNGLEEEARFYDEQYAIDEYKYNAAYEKHNEKQSEYHQAKALNERFTELEQKENKQKQLHEQAPVFSEKEKQLEAAERASHLELYEKQTIDWRLEVRNKSEFLQKAEIAKKEADTFFKKAKDFFEYEEKKQTERDDISRKLDRLTEHLPIVKDLENQKRSLADLKQKGKKTVADLKTINTDLQSKTESAEKWNEKIKMIDEAVGKLYEKQQGLNEMKDKARVLQAFLKKVKEQGEVEKEVSNTEKAQQLIKAKYDELMDVWMNNQASFLASHLHNGDACPVCGSLEHPNKAIATERMITKEELDILKRDFDEKDKLYRNAITKQSAIQNRLMEITEELATFNIATEDAEDIYEKLIVDGKKLKEEVNYLKKQQDELRELKKWYEKETEAIKALENSKMELEKSFQDHKTAYETTKAVYEERLRNIPEDVRILSELEKRINETKNMKVSLEKAWTDAQEAFHKAKTDQTKALADLENINKQLVEANEKLANAEREFTKARIASDFQSEEEYERAKMPNTDRHKLKQEIQEFNDQFQTINRLVEELRESLKDKVKVDLIEIEKELEQLKQAYEIALSQLNRSKENYKEAVKLKESIIEADRKVQQNEKQLALVTDLYDVLRGQNSQKISFERYLQIEYLEQIIEAANGRLSRLSNGQFYLIRSDRQETHGRQSGLGLDVYDSYTGQTRDVKTLSGGEKFNASLCLALGMSDVIQSFQGNISIRTMFIDEGFGSLDEESLNKAIDTLIDLQQSGRMIGVISHVQELKTMFPAVLEVLKTKEGYSKTAFVLK